MRFQGRVAGPLLLGLFVGLSIAAFAVVAPVHAGKPSGGGGTSTTYSCSVTVSHSGGDAGGTFTVKTTISASGGSLPGPTLTEYLSSYRNGVLYNTQSVTVSVAKNTASTTIYIPVPSNSEGAYTFQATILNSKGKQIASCSGTYSL